MAKLIRTLQKLNYEFKAKLDQFCNQYKEKVGVSVDPEINLEPGEHGYVFTARISGLPKSKSKKENRKRLVAYIEGFLSGESIDQICGYGTRISYVEVRDTEYEYLEGFHFDYRKRIGERIQGGHPLFHLQLDKKAASDFVRSELEGRCPGQEVCNNYFLKQIRVPSVQMDIFSCVLMVVADHLFCDEVEADFKSLINNVHCLIPSMNMSDHDAATQLVFSERKLSSSAWYFASF